MSAQPADRTSAGEAVAGLLASLSIFASLIGEPCGPGLGLCGRGRHGGLGSGSSASTGSCAGSGGFGSALTAQ